MHGYENTLGWRTSWKSLLTLTREAFLFFSFSFWIHAMMQGPFWIHAMMQGQSRGFLNKQRCEGMMNLQRASNIKFTSFYQKKKKKFTSDWAENSRMVETYTKSVLLRTASYSSVVTDAHIKWCRQSLKKKTNTHTHKFFLQICFFNQVLWTLSIN